MTKPFTFVSCMHEAGDLARFHLSVSTDGQHLYLQTFADGVGVNQLNSITLDRSTVEWLVEQLEEALKNPQVSSRKDMS